MEPKESPRANKMHPTINAWRQTRKGCKKRRSGPLKCYHFGTLFSFPFRDPKLKQTFINFDTNFQPFPIKMPIIDLSLLWRFEQRLFIFVGSRPRRKNVRGHVFHPIKPMVFTHPAIFDIQLLID